MHPKIRTKNLEQYSGIAVHVRQKLYIFGQIEKDANYVILVCIYKRGILIFCFALF
jgi:hypothetical protein